MTSDLELHPDLAPAPTTLFASASPAVIVQRATEVANAIAPLIRDQNLVKRIGQSEHVFLEGWTLAGTMLGVFPITVSSGAIFAADGTVTGYQATVEARTMAGAVVGRADAECTRDENKKWEEAPSFQLRSMAITRASSKALRMPLGFVMKLAGYETTPAEEMEAAAARGETVSGGRGVRPGWRDINEQQRAHADLGAEIDEHGLRPWVAEWCDSKGYQRPLAKGQFSQLKNAIQRELEARRKSPPTPVQEASSAAGRAGVEGANHSKTDTDQAAPNADGVTAPPGAADDHPPGRRSPGGPNRPTSGGAKGSRPDTPGRGSSAKPEEFPGAAAGGDEPDPRRFAR
jgi:hypothetical protein